MHNVTVCTSNISDDNIKPLLGSYQSKLGPAATDRINSLDRQVAEIESSFVPRHVQLLFETDPSELTAVEQSPENNTAKAMTIMAKLKEEQGKLGMLFGSLRDNVDHAKSELRTLNRIVDQLKS